MLTGDEEINMGLKIEYRDMHGRKHGSLADLVETESEKLVDEAAKNVERAIRGQRCAVHGQSATVSISKSSNGFS
jgi:hypothetical protein